MDSRDRNKMLGLLAIGGVCALIDPRETGRVLVAISKPDKSKKKKWANPKVYTVKEVMENRCNAYGFAL